MSDQISSGTGLPFAGTHRLQTHGKGLPKSFPHFQRDSALTGFLTLPFHWVMLLWFVLSSPGLQEPWWPCPAARCPIAPVQSLHCTSIRDVSYHPPSCSRSQCSPRPETALAALHTHTQPLPLQLWIPQTYLRFTFQLQTPKPLGRWPVAVLSLPTPAWRSPHRRLLGAGLCGCLPRAHTECAVSRACLGAGAGIGSKAPVCAASVFEKGHLAGLAVQAQFAGRF